MSPLHFSRSHQVTSVRCSDGSEVSGDAFVLAAGVRSNALGRSVGITLPVYPVRGNVVTVRTNVSRSFRDWFTWEMYFPLSAAVDYRVH